jgi:uncharacterized protein YecE (DUF72 family)
MLRAGTSGYSFREWVGSFYPPTTPAKKYLAYYTLKAFLSDLPRHHRFAVEFRHPSWNEPAIIDTLRNADVALCAVGVEIGESDVLSTAPHGYIRLRKVPPYTEEEIAVAHRQIRDTMERVDDLYCYIKHDDGGSAPDTALRLQSLVEGKEK